MLFHCRFLLFLSGMKKRHEQKLVIISLGLFFIFNVPLIFMFNHLGSIFGFPILYFAIFFIWLLSIVATYFILKRYYE
jgi:hypothetical protein